MACGCSNRGGPCTSVSPSVVVGLLLSGDGGTPRSRVLVYVGTRSFPANVPVVRVKKLFMSVFEGVIVGKGVRVHICGSRARSMGRCGLWFGRGGS